jgi:hypothetical protein
MTRKEIRYFLDAYLEQVVDRNAKAAYFSARPRSLEIIEDEVVAGMAVACAFIKRGSTPDDLDSVLRDIVYDNKRIASPVVLAAALQSK